MENQHQPQQNTSLCNGGCGFYGSPATEGLCSKCFKDSIKRQQDTTARLSPNSSSSSGASPAAPLSSTSAAAASLSIATAMAEVVAAAQQAPVTAPTQVQPLEGGASLGITPTDSSASLSTSGSSASLNASVNSNAAAAAAIGDASSTPPQKKPNRCNECKKRVGLTGFSCRCGGLYCSDHRYDSAHACSFDYKTMEREQLAANNPKLVAEKIKRL